MPIAALVVVPSKAVASHAHSTRGLVWSAAASKSALPLWITVSAEGCLTEHYAAPCLPYLRVIDKGGGLITVFGSITEF